MQEGQRVRIVWNGCPLVAFHPLKLSDGWSIPDLGEVLSFPKTQLVARLILTLHEERLT